jgi:hypothetical protein
MRVRDDSVSAWNPVGALTMRANLLVLLFFCLVLVFPVVATDVSFTAPSGKAISTIDVSAPVGSTGYVYVIQEDGNTTLCSWSYMSKVNLFGGTGAMAITNIAGMTTDMSSYTYQTSGNLQLEAQQRGETPISAPAILFKSGQIAPAWNEQISSDTSHSPVLSYRVTSDQDVDVSHTLMDYDKAVTDVSALSKVNDTVNYLLSLVGSFIDFIFSFVYWIKYFFVDNLFMIVTLFLAVPMAFAAKNSKGNPERFLRQYFGTLKGFFGFVVWLWTVLIRTVAYIRGMFKIV